MILKLFALTFSLFILSGCGENSDETAVPQNTTAKEIPIVIDSEASLADQMSRNVETADNYDEFALESMNSILGYVVEEYVPSFLESYVLESDSFTAEVLVENETIAASLQSFYEEETNFFSPLLRGSEDSTLMDIVYAIIDELQNMLTTWLSSFFYGEESEEVPIDRNDTYEVDPTLPVGFALPIIAGKTFHVISNVADMRVDMSTDGLSGVGVMGILSMSFTDSIDANDDLIIKTNLMGDYKIVMTYRDKSYCIAADAIDESGTVYESYWFTYKSDMEKATSVSSARDLCYIHSAEYNDSKVEIDEGELETIEDVRTGHEVQTGSTTTEIVEALISGITTVADYSDAKYFARQLRHGVFSLYTTNGKEETVQTKETENIMRELMPLGASSAIGMQDLLSEAFDLSIAFQDEVTADLNNTFNAMNPRLSALANATDAAMQQTMDSDNYYGSATSSFGDKVEMGITDMDTNICLVFFLCESSVDATVNMRISNPGTNGNYADIEFNSRINATSMDINSINFSSVQASQDLNIIGANGYRLEIDYFKYHRGNGTLDLQGKGSISDVDGGSNATTAVLDSYDIRVYLQEQGTLNFVFKSISAALDGSITTALGKAFDGTMYFDKTSTENNELNGTLSDSSSDIVIDGTMKASLTYADIDLWMNGHADVGVEEGLPYLIDANGNKELVESLTNNGRIEVRTFETYDNSYTCEKVEDGVYSCSDFSKRVTKTMKFTTPDELLLVNTNDGDYYILNIQNVFSYSLSELIMMRVSDRHMANLSEFDYRDADINNVRLASSAINEPVDINNIGDQNYLVNAKITKENQLFSADMMMSRDETADTWTYTIYDLVISDDYGQIKADEANLIQSGNNELVNVAEEMIVNGMNMDLDLDALMNLGFASVEGFDYINLHGFEMSMMASSGEAKIKTNFNLINHGSQIIMDSNVSYDYGMTHFNALADFDVAVTTAGDGTKTYDSAFTSKGFIQADAVADYDYELEYATAKQTLLFTRKDTGYQMGFTMDESGVQGADSYGVKADFVMNETLDVVEAMTIKDSAGTTLGSYNRATDALKVYFTDSTTEYLYLY